MGFIRLVENKVKPLKGDQAWPVDVFRQGCADCPRMAAFLSETRAAHPKHFACPVPPFGDEKADLLIVGLAPGMHGANRTGRPFTGDYCGPLLYETLHRHGFANRADSVAVGDGMALHNARVSNAVKCVPPENKPLPAEIRTCNRFLKAELEQYTPRIVVALGLVAHQATVMALGGRPTTVKFAHGALHRVGGSGIALLDSYHVSRYNTQTGRLTASMFDEIIATAKALLAA